MAVTVRRSGDKFEVTAQDVTFRAAVFAIAKAYAVWITAQFRQDPTGQLFPCDWLVQDGWTEDGEAWVVPCGAPAFGVQRGWYCEHGHGHVSAEYRDAEGWDYYDEDEIAAVRSGHRAPMAREMVPMGASGWGH